MMKQNKQVNKLQDLEEWYIEQQIFVQMAVEIPNLIQLVIFSLGLLQSITFLQIAVWNVSERKFEQSFETLFGVIYLTRFDIAFQTFSAQFDYLFLVPLIMIFFGDIIPTLILILSEKLMTEFKDGFLIQRFQQIQSIYSQVFSQFLYIPLTCLCIISIEVSMINYPLLILKLFVIFLLLITLLIKYVVQLETIDLKVYVLQQLNSSILDFFKCVLIILQLITFSFINDVSTGILFQGILIILIQIIQITQIFGLSCCNLTKIKVKLLSSSFGIVCAILKLLELNYPNVHYQYTCIVLIVTPIFFEFLLKLFMKFDDDLLQIIYKEQRIQQIKYYFAKIFNEQFDNKQQYNIALSRVMIDLQLSNNNIANVDICQCNFQQIMPQKLVNRFHGKLLKKLRKSIAAAGKSNQINYVIHYMAILYRLGYSNLAFQQVTCLLNQRSHKSLQKFSSQNGNNDSQPRNLQINMSGKSLQADKSMSKESKSQELQDVKQQQYTRLNKFLITVTQSLTILCKVKIQILKDRIKQQMQSQFILKNSNNESINIKLSVQLFLEAETKNQNIKQQLLEFLNHKLQFYLSLQSQKAIRTPQLYSSAMKLCYSMLQLEERLEKLYDQFPSQKIQSIISYLQGEILNNILEAFRFKSTSALSDEKLLNVHKNINTNLFSKNLVYLNIILEDETQQLVIVGSSESAHQLFQCSPEVLKANNTIDILLPEAIKGEHQLLVSRFIQSGQSKFYLNNCRNFCKVDHLIVKPISFFFDIQLNIRNEIQFFAFFEELIVHSSYILLDVNGKIGGVTLEFFYKVGSRPINLETIPIEYIFPEFSTFFEQKETTFYTKLLFGQFSESKEITNKSINQQWSEDNINIFEALISLEYQELFGYHYVIIQIKDIKKKKGYVDNQYFDDNFQIEESIKSESCPNSPEIIIHPNFNHSFDSKNFQILINQVNQSVIQEDIKQDDQSRFELNILSPNLSQNPLMSSKLPHNKYEQQQEYFNANSKNLSLSSSVREKQPQEQFEQEQDIYKNLQNQIIALQGNNQAIQQKQSNGSETSSFAGIKKSIFYKKYEIVTKVLLPILPKNLKLFLFFIILQLITCSIFGVMILTENNSDLEKFIQEIDMIELHAGFMAPHDICLGMRITVVSYEIYIINKVITREKFLELADPLYNNQDFGYNELKDNFYKQLTNPTLQEFFKNRNISVVLMNRDATSVYNVEMNIREALFAMLHYYYQFKLRFEQRKSPANQTYQVFQFANILNFHYWMEELTLEIYNYSKSRSVTINNKWIVIWLIFLCTTFCLFILNTFYLSQFLNKQDKYLNLFKYCQTSKLGRDIERYKSMIKILGNNSDFIFHYSFDLEQKEHFLINEKPKFQLDWKNAKEAKNQNQYNFDPISKTYRYFLLSLVWIVFLIYCTIANQETLSYLTRYNKTTDLYKLIQDMTYSTGSLYQLRNFKLLWSNFTYLTQLDNERLYESIYAGFKNIDKYHQVFINFDPSIYLISDGFLNYFNGIQSHNVCDYVGVDVIEFLEQYCNKSLGGSLMTGLQPTLNYIKYSIENQMAVNNFTKRIEYLYFESEGGMIVIKAFQIMTNKLKEDIVLKTEQSQRISNDLSIAYLVYAICIAFLILVYIKNYLVKEFYVAKKFIQLIPTAVLFFDDQFERNIRILILSQEN